MSQYFWDLEILRNRGVKNGGEANGPNGILEPI